MVAAALGDCVHVAGLHAVLQTARQFGWQCIMLGPAVSPERVVAAVKAENPEMVALSYRLTPEAGKQVVQQFWQLALSAGIVTPGRRFVFGGTPPVCSLVREVGKFEAVFDGTQPPQEVVALFDDRRRALRATPAGSAASSDGQAEGALAQALFAQTLEGRIAAAKPWPIIRHHFGQPTLEATIRGIEELADSGLVDVISLGIDQNTQEHFFHPQEKDPAQRGAGGVPVDTPEEFRRLYAASRRGNYPLMRCYSGTRDLLRMQKMLVETIHLAWAAIPLTWYSVLDGRSQRPLQQTIGEAQEVIRWLAGQGVPVEMNESHHWSLRDAHDVVAVTMAFLAAYNAKQAGVRQYVAQYMFNNPPLTSFRMDLAKMLAKVELIEALHEDGRAAKAPGTVSQAGLPAAGSWAGAPAARSLAAGASTANGPISGFRSWRQTRLGLRSHPVDLVQGKGHLAASVLLQMALNPDIVHVVAYTEADHAATAAEIIESVKIARGVIADALGGLPDLTADPLVQERKEHLLREVQVLLRSVAALGLAMRQAAGEGRDVFTDPVVLTEAIRLGLIDAPHLAGNPASEACGRVVTNVVNGAYEAIDPTDGRVLREEERIGTILKERAPAAYQLFQAGEEAQERVDRVLGIAATVGRRQ
ncbi:MAG: cobalamin B12-binding domain-containing protein [Limnochordaceae bacterium]|nr:cobalamin B12-binding domain-containing protein [Limnochordaceae bacterium]